MNRPPAPPRLIPPGNPPISRGLLGHAAPPRRQRRGSALPCVTQPQTAQRQTAPPAAPRSSRQRHSRVSVTPRRITAMATRTATNSRGTRINIPLPAMPRATRQGEGGPDLSAGPDDAQGHLHQRRPLRHPHPLQPNDMPAPDHLSRTTPAKTAPPTRAPNPPGHPASRPDPEPAPRTAPMEGPTQDQHRLTGTGSPPVQAAPPAPPPAARHARPRPPPPSRPR